jgi:hypothetical protein
VWLESAYRERRAQDGSGHPEVPDVSRREALSKGADYSTSGAQDES